MKSDIVPNTPHTWYAFAISLGYFAWASIINHQPTKN